MDDLDLAAYGLKYLEADPTTVYLDYDGSPPWLFFNDSERTIESIGRHRPSQAEAYRRYLADARPVAELTLEMGTGVASTPRMLARLLARRGRGGARLLQWSRASALDVLRSYFDDEALVMPTISNGPTVWGAPPDAPGTGLAGALYAMRHMVKTGRPVGGSGALTDALAASFQAAGGRLSCGTPVAGLLGDGRGVRGVRAGRRHRDSHGRSGGDLRPHPSGHAVARGAPPRKSAPLRGPGPLAGARRRVPVQDRRRRHRSSPLPGSGGFGAGRPVRWARYRSVELCDIPVDQRAGRGPPAAAPRTGGGAADDDGQTCHRSWTRRCAAATATTS